MGKETHKPNIAKIEELRIRKGWSLDQLAVRSVLSGRTLNNIVKGESVVISTIAKLAKALDVEPATLLEGFEPEQPSAEPMLSRLKLIYSTPFDEFDETAELPKVLEAMRALRLSNRNVMAHAEDAEVVVTVEVVTRQLVKKVNSLAGWDAALWKLGVVRHECEYGADYNC